MSDQVDSNAGAKPRAEDIRYFAERASPAFDEVVVEADYAARAAVSFWRFRQLGGDSGGKKARLAVGGGTSVGVHYVSDYPAVRVFHLSIIALLVLFESAANAYFFAQQSEFGLAGGLFQAAAVSLANVVTSYFIIGYWGLRHITVPWTWALPWDWTWRHYTRLFGCLAILGGLTLVLLVNLSAAHYRNLIDLRAEGLAAPTEFTATVPRFLYDTEMCRAVLTSEIGQSIGSAATNAMCRPFALHSLDAMVLFALGMAIAALAAFEGRRSDSPFPGFSDAARVFERARISLRNALDEYYETYDEVVADAKKMFPQFSVHDEIELRRRLDERVAPYQTLLTSDPDLLRDEFAVPSEVIERVTHKTPTIPDGGTLAAKAGAKA
jgi:hypothetical protein